MSQKNLYICPRCYQFHVLKENAVFTNCAKCNAVLDLVHYDYERYSQLDDESKKAFRLQYIDCHYSKKRADGFIPMPQSGWVSFIGLCGWISFVLCIIGSVFCLLSGGILYAIVVALAGAISCGLLILIAIIAEDVRHIRNQVDKLHYDNQNK